MKTPAATAASVHHFRAIAMVPFRRRPLAADVAADRHDMISKQNCQ
jgi:hypothetical protein